VHLRRDQSKTVHRQILFIIEQKRSIQRRIWARKETQIYWEIYFSRGKKKSIGSYILAGNKTTILWQKNSAGDKRRQFTERFIRKRKEVYWYIHCSREQTYQSGERIQNGKRQKSLHAATLQKKQKTLTISKYTYWLFLMAPCNSWWWCAPLGPKKREQEIP